MTSNVDTFSLLDIGLGVAEGDSLFPGNKVGSLPVEGLLRVNGASTGQIEVFPNLAVPYLNLPSDTYNAIADFLPVTFDTRIGLYLWDTADGAYNLIIGSPAYLSFTFDSETGTNGTILCPIRLTEPNTGHHTS